MCTHKQAQKLAYAVMYDAFKDLGKAKFRENAVAFLTGNEVNFWAELVERSPKDIKRKAKEIYNNPKLLPEKLTRTVSHSGRKSRYS